MINLISPISIACLVSGLIVGFYVGFRLTSRFYRKDDIENQILRFVLDKLFKRTDKLLELVDRSIHIEEKHSELLKKLVDRFELISFYLKEMKVGETKVNGSGRKSKEIG